MAIRLRDQDAEFVGSVQEKSWRRQGDQIVGAQGVMFQCPKCSAGLRRGEEGERRYVIGAHYALVFFHNPQGASCIPAEWHAKIARWEMTGTCLDDLTTRPSILFQPPGCGWHGYITNGELHE
jgi:hypothetical protein